MDRLPAPEVVRRYVDDRFAPPLPAVCLSWEAEAMGLAERLWYLPDGVCMVGPAPERFGIAVQRYARDAYEVRVLWNHTCLSWAAVTRVQLLASALAAVMQALGRDLWQLLDQPVAAGAALAGRAA